MSDLKKFVVTYTIDYHHRVVVGVTASDSKAAIKLASDAFDEASIWDNTAEMPLLFDDFEEVDGETLEFSAEEIQGRFPEPDSSVKDMNEKAFAFYCAQALLAGEITSAIQFAKKALPKFVESTPKETTWSVKSDNGCDPFEVIAAGREDAFRDALHAIGWTVAPKQDDHDGSPSECAFECDQCGRIYDDADECLSDDCPTKDELLTSSDVLILADSHDLQLSKLLDGGLQSSHILSGCLFGELSHKGDDGKNRRITSKDFLRAYPNSLGKVWRVEKKISVKTVPRMFAVIRDAILRKALNVSFFSPLTYLL